MAFNGSYLLSIDDKGRLRIPAKFRNQIVGDVILCAGTNGSLFVMGEAEYSANILSRISEVPLYDTVRQNEIRKMASTIQVVDQVDEQGRFVLSPKLKNYAKIDKKVVFLGMFSRIEIYAEEEYKKQFEETVDMDESVRVLKV